MSDVARTMDRQAGIESVTVSGFNQRHVVRTLAQATSFADFRGSVAAAFSLNAAKPPWQAKQGWGTTETALKNVADTAENRWSSNVKAEILGTSCCFGVA